MEQVEDLLNYTLLLDYFGSSSSGGAGGHNGLGESSPAGFNVNLRHKVNFTSDDDISEVNLPSEMVTLPISAWPAIIAYCIVFVVASVGNLLEFIAVSQRLRKRCSPMNILLMNLCIADLIVVLAVAAVEIAWRISIGWYVGDVLCKGVHFFRTFGLYSSSLVLICLSMDRYYAVLHPLKVVDAFKRVKHMLIVSWITAALLSLPQCFVFGVRHHPRFPEFTQCTSVGVTAETVNTALSLTFMYFLPIMVILFCYGNIICRLAKDNHAARTGQFLRRSDVTLMDRAKIRTLKLTSVIVLVFIFCWSPYVIISMWHVVDQASAEKLNPFLQDALFIMVVANSCANPLVYGVFHGGSRRSGGTSGPNNNASTAYTMTSVCQRSTKTSSSNRHRVSIQTDCVDSVNGRCVTHLVPTTISPTFPPIKESSTDLN